MGRRERDHVTKYRIVTGPTSTWLNHRPVSLAVHGVERDIGFHARLMTSGEKAGTDRASSPDRLKLWG